MAEPKTDGVTVPPLGPRSSRYAREYAPQAGDLMVKVSRAELCKVAFGVDSSKENIICTQQRPWPLRGVSRVGDVLVAVNKKPTIAVKSYPRILSYLNERRNRRAYELVFRLPQVQLEHVPPLSYRTKCPSGTHNVEGFLRKLSRSGMFRRQRWQDRYFVLDAERKVLRRYAESRSTTALGDSKDLDLSTVECVMETGVQPVGHSGINPVRFSLRLKDGEERFFEATTTEDCRVWVSCLAAVLGQNLMTTEPTTYVRGYDPTKEVVPGVGTVDGAGTGSSAGAGASSNGTAAGAASSRPSALSPASAHTASSMVSPAAAAAAGASTTAAPAKTTITSPAAATSSTTTTAPKPTPSTTTTTTAAGSSPARRSTGPSTAASSSTMSSPPPPPPVTRRAAALSPSSTNGASPRKRAGANRGTGGGTGAAGDRTPRAASTPGSTRSRGTKSPGVKSPGGRSTRSSRSGKSVSPNRRAARAAAEQRAQEAAAEEAAARAAAAEASQRRVQEIINRQKDNATDEFDIVYERLQVLMLPPKEASAASSRRGRRGAPPAADAPPPRLGLSLSDTPDGRIFVAAILPNQQPAPSALDAVVGRDGRRGRSQSRNKKGGGRATSRGSRRSVSPGAASVGGSSVYSCTSYEELRHLTRQMKAAAAVRGSTGGVGGIPDPRAPSPGGESIASGAFSTADGAGDDPDNEDVELLVFDEANLPLVTAEGLNPETGEPVTAPAESAGLRPGDVIMALDSLAVKRTDTLASVAQRLLRRTMSRGTWVTVARPIGRIARPKHAPVEAEPGLGLGPEAEAPLMAAPVAVPSPTVVSPQPRAFSAHDTAFVSPVAAAAASPVVDVDEPEEDPHFRDNLMAGPGSDIDPTPVDVMVETKAKEDDEYVARRRHGENGDEAETKFGPEDDDHMESLSGAQKRSTHFADEYDPDVAAAEGRGDATLDLDALLDSEPPVKERTGNGHYNAYPGIQMMQVQDVDDAAAPDTDA